MSETASHTFSNRFIFRRDSDFFHERSRIGLKFENAQHFLHIYSYARVIAAQYDVRRTTDSIVCYANSDACPYSGFVREVTAITYGVRR